MYPCVQAAAVNAQAVHLFTKLLCRRFTARQFHACAIKHIVIGLELFVKLPERGFHLGDSCIVFFYLRLDLADAGLRLGNVFFHTLGSLDAACDAGFKSGGLGVAFGSPALCL